MESESVHGHLSLYNDQGHELVRIENLELRYLENKSSSLVKPQEKASLTISATFTAEPIKGPLSFWMDKLGIPARVNFAPYNQVFQELLSPESLLASNQRGANLILIRPGDWLKQSATIELQVSQEEKQQLIENKKTHRLANGLEVAHLNNYETDYVFQEIFGDRAYLRHGISLKDGDCIFDIGANIGLFMLFVQSLDINAKLYSFEPAPETFACLETNTALYGKNARAFQCGISDRDTVMPFTFYPNSSVFSSFVPDETDDRKAISAVVRNVLEQDQSLEAEQIDEYAEELVSQRLESKTIDVPLRSVSSMIRKLGVEKIDLLKVDVEKVELDVLKGIEDQHWPIIRQIVIEVHDRSGELIEAVQNLLKEKGFIFEIEEENLLQGSGLYNIYAKRSSEQAEAPQKSEEEEIYQHCRDFAQALHSAASNSQVPNIVCLCPEEGRGQEQFQKIEQTLKEELETIPGVELVRADTLTTNYKPKTRFDAQSNELGHIPYTDEYFKALASGLARKLDSLWRKPYKVIVLDCDNTLWGGVCGEQPPEDLNLSGPYQKLQELLVEQQKNGLLLCLASKNSPEDVEAVFKARSEMPLKPEHIVASKINWQPKSDNIRELAEELSLGLDSFIFLDDSPIECADLRAACPQVLSLELPQDKKERESFLKNIWAFDQKGSTSEDSRRTAMYRAQIKREELKKQTPSLEDFIQGLELKIDIQAPTEAELSRAAQLTQRTNQFNLTTIRRDEAELGRLLNSGKLTSRRTIVEDRFGDYGFVGLLLFSSSKEALRLDSFLLSCRVLGRGVEHQMLAELAREAKAQSIEEIQIPFEKTAKNQPALDFLNSLPAKNAQENLYTFETNKLANLRYQPKSRTNDNQQAQQKESRLLSDSQSGRSEIFQEIAGELNNLDSITTQIQQQKQSRPSSLGNFAAAKNKLQAQIVKLWEEILGLEQVGIHDNFFDIGGSSLKAVQLVAQLRNEFSIELPIVSLFEASTLEALASLIQSEQSSGSTASKETLSKSQERGQKRRQRAARSRKRRANG